MTELRYANKIEFLEQLGCEGIGYLNMLRRGEKILFAFNFLLLKNLAPSSCILLFLYIFSIFIHYVL